MDRVHEETLKHNREQSKSGNWAGMMASLSLGKEMQEQLKNRQAENQWVRKHLWEKCDASPEDDVEKYVMGDNHETIIHQAQAGLGTLAKAGIAAALIGSGVGAGLGIPLILSAVLDGTEQVETPETPDPDIIVQPGTDTDWKLGTPIVE